VGADGTPHVVPVGFSYNADPTRSTSAAARIYPERVISRGLDGAAQG
jgi:hypothetical protein